MPCVVMHLPTTDGLFGVPSEVGQEMNVLMPDNCTVLDDPVLAEDLLPAERFDRPELRRLPEDFRQAAADSNLDVLLSKACAGLHHDLWASYDEMRAGFRSGQFPARVEAAVRWNLSGLRVADFRVLACRCGVPLQDLVRDLWTLCGNGRMPHAAWMNQWARDPKLPAPIWTTAAAFATTCGTRGNPLGKVCNFKLPLTRRTARAPDGVGSRFTMRTSANGMNSPSPKRSALRPAKRPAPRLRAFGSAVSARLAIMPSAFSVSACSAKCPPPERQIS